MTSSMPPSPDDPSMPPPSSARQGKPWVVPGAIGVVAGLVVGVLIGTFVVGGGAAGGGADADARTACQYIDTVSDDIEPDVALDLEEPTIWRLQAIGPLATAAATSDERYETFGEQGGDLYSAISRLDHELLFSTLEAMQESCRSF
ncbi:hypothetical protein [Pseudactinotalea sp.]|uniref:hypothetical protein n=1 Tax=Pseudactinotalea sp. TaxID=1926260 RepID=UPI003B3B0727